MRQLFLSAAHKSSGKTTLSIGLCAALREAGHSVQPFKKGPDYIDPMWLGMAAGRPCYNLDFYTMGPDEIRQAFAGRAAQADISLVEGNKGLFDGLDIEGGNSNAALASLLGSPVVLVLDVRGMTRGVAPLILGYQGFTPKVEIAGVVLNQLGGARHESKLRAVIEHYTDVPVLGAVGRDPALSITERHLGLVPGNESEGAGQVVERLASAVAAQVDVEAILAHAAPLEPALYAQASEPDAPEVRETVRIGVARDSAFGFYYADDLEALQAAGARLEFFSPLSDQALPEVDALFIGGGFPETHLDMLQANQAMREQIADAVESGMPVYAECGGLMYLARSIRWGDRQADMVGALPFSVQMCERPQGRGYVRLRETKFNPWHDDRGTQTEWSEIPAHEFHYSRAEDVSAPLTFAYEVVRGEGFDGERDGVVHRNCLASYSHLRDVQGHHWAARFIAFARRCMAA